MVPLYKRALKPIFVLALFQLGAYAQVPLPTIDGSAHRLTKTQFEQAQYPALQGPTAPSNLRTSVSNLGSYGTYIGFTWNDNQVFGSSPSKLIRFGAYNLQAVWKYALSIAKDGQGIGTCYKDGSNNWLLNTPADSMRHVLGQPITGPLRLPVGNAVFGKANPILNNYIESGHFLNPVISRSGGINPHKPIVLFNTAWPSRSATRPNAGRFLDGRHEVPPFYFPPTPWTMDFTRLERSTVDKRMAPGDAGVYLLASTAAIGEDSLYTIGTGLAYPLTLLGSTDAGYTWSRINVPGLTRADGVLGIQSFSTALAVRKSTIAFFVSRYVNPRSPALELVLYKSIDAGLSWQQKTVFKSVISNFSFPVNGISNRAFIPHGDGCISAIIDSGNVVHMVTGNGYTFADSTINEESVWLNGALKAEHASLIYWNDRPNTEAKQIAHVVLNTSNPFPNGFGTYPQAQVSMANLSTDMIGNLYVTYSGLVGDTRATGTNRASRDIFIVTSINGGASFSPPINVSKVFGGHAILYGSDNIEDTYPSAVDLVGHEDSLDFSWFSSLYTGKSPRNSIHPLTISAMKISAMDIRQRYIAAIFPKEAVVNRGFQVPYKIGTHIWSSSWLYNSNNSFVVQIDTSRAGDFSRTSSIVTMGALAATHDNTISCSVPRTLLPGQYKIRVMATAPRTTDPIFSRYSNIESISIIGTTPNVVMASPAINGMPPAGTQPISLCGAQDLTLSTHRLTGGGFTATNWFVKPLSAGVLTKLNDSLVTLSMAVGYTGNFSINVAGVNALGAGDTAITNVLIRPNPYAISLSGTGLNATASLLFGAITPGQYVIYIIRYRDNLTGENAIVKVPQTSLLNTIGSMIPVGIDPTYVTVQLQIGDCLTNEVFLPATVTSTIAQVQSVSKLNIYPNPTSGRFVVSMTNYAGRGVVRIYNSMGQVIATQGLDTEENGATTTFELGQIPAGLYTVQVETGTGVKTSRLVVE